MTGHGVAMTGGAPEVAAARTEGDAARMVVVAGAPDDVETAALVAVLGALGSRPAPPARRRPLPRAGFTDPRGWRGRAGG